MDRQKKEETVAKILQVLDGFNYIEAHLALEDAQNALKVTTFLSARSFVDNQESVDKRQDTAC